MNKLEVKNLSYKSILKDINMTFKKNTFYLVAGSNKCGKTTLLKILSNQIEVKNSIYYNNKDINEFNSYNLSTTIGIVDINDNYSFSTINQELSYMIDKLAVDNKEGKKKIKELVSLFELKEYLYNNIEELPLYIKIEFLLVKELLKTPKILILDDIFSNIENSISINIINKLKKIEDLIVILSSVSLDISTEFDYIYILNNGSILLEGSIYDVLKEDSLLNKNGLELPFMVDLSLKLKYYDLLDDIELNMNRMVNKLWK